eukprot:18530-Heterococcus_DN1.PRE.6
MVMTVRLNSVSKSAQRVSSCMIVHGMQVHARCLYADAMCMYKTDCKYSCTATAQIGVLQIKMTRWAVVNSSDLHKSCITSTQSCAGCSSYTALVAKNKAPATTQWYVRIGSYLYNRC